MSIARISEDASYDPAGWSWPDELFRGSAPSGPAALQSVAGRRITLDHRRWHADASAADLTLLERCRGSVLDVGCGPGRLAHALVLSGRVALGIDTSASAIAATLRRGAPAVRTSVYGFVPRSGQWGTAILADGNIGIGGNAAALLRRVARLIVPSGLVLVEVESPATISEDLKVRVDHRGKAGWWFPWSRVGAADLPDLARSAGLALDDLWHHSGRWFAQLASSSGSVEDA